MTRRAKSKLEKVAPNSQPILKSSAFKAWFGESKVTDSRGRPQIMYHGTYVDFDGFNASHAFHCFTPDPLAAEEHANDSYSSFKDDPGGAAIIIMPVYIRSLKPFDPWTPECIALMRKWGLGDPSRYDYAIFEDLEDLEVAARIESLGFDGIWMRLETPYDMLTIFRPNQVKSAIGNSGRFNPESSSLTDPCCFSL